jgi:hypothetical protein
MSSAFDRMMGNQVNGEVDIVGGPYEIIGDKAVLVPDVDKPGQYTEGKFTAQDRIDVGFSNNGQVIAPGADVVFTAQVSTPFKPEEMIIPSNLAPDLAVAAVVIGPNSYIDGGAIQAAAYTEVSTARKVSWATVQTSVPIKITLRNISAAPVNGWVNLRGLRLR